MNGKQIPLIKHESIDELKRLRNKSSIAQEIKRFDIIILIQSKDISSFEASRNLSVSPETARQTLLKYNELGAKGLIDKRYNNQSGDTFKTPEILERIDNLLQEDCIYGGAWNGVKLQHWVHENYGRKVAYSTVYNWLKDLGYSWKYPRPKHKDSNELEKEKFKKNNLSD
jgi:transposase